MNKTKDLVRVLSAESKARRQLADALTDIQEGLRYDDTAGFLTLYGPWVRELNYVNEHITVPDEEIDAAVKEYTDVANHLVMHLGWSDQDIDVLPQGSASTQTLIRTPDRSKFDIDAVCQVDISRVAANNPIGFFEAVGDGLKKYEAIAKRRCWNINYKHKTFYLEFTPSVPLGAVSQSELASMSPVYGSEQHYFETALAVVDTPTRKWKTSNPEGYTRWVNDAANHQLIRYLITENKAVLTEAGVAPVPDQDVQITDTLRVAIRLFKRHRDMCVYRGVIDKEYKPISIIIVTLLTSCYRGLADMGRTYEHPIQLLVDLAQFLPGMVDDSGSKYHVDNPTVVGENFAEKWNEDDGERARAFETWCDILEGDLRRILAITNEDDLRREIRDIFGCGNEKTTPVGPGGGGGVTTKKSWRPRPAPSIRGLS